MRKTLSKTLCVMACSYLIWNCVVHEIMPTQNLWTYEIPGKCQCYYQNPKNTCYVNSFLGKMASVELYHLSITDFNRMSLISNGLTFKRKNEAKEVLSLVFVQNWK